MLSTIRETLASIKDKSYGNVIITKRLWPVIWYWTKYLLVFTVVPWLVFVFLLTYFLPQLPRTLKDNLPDAKVSLQNGRFSTNLNQPAVIGDKSFSFIIDTNSTPEILNNYDSGVLISSTAAYLKSSDGSYDSSAFPAKINFSTDKNQITSWVSSHQGNLWVVGFFGLTLLTLLFSGFYWLYNLISFAFGGLLFWLLARFTNRQLDYRGAVKIAIYAAVLPFLINALLSSSSNPILYIVNLALFFYLGYNWISKLPQLSPEKTVKNP